MLMSSLLIFALNCLLQIEHVNSENEDTDGDPLVLALRSLRFRSASQTLCFICSPSDGATPLRSILCYLFPEL